jgi:hypothetical protein
VLPTNPVRLDPRFLLAERERRIHARVAYRLQELEQLLPTLSGPAYDSAVLEMRQLRVRTTFLSLRFMSLTLFSASGATAEDAARARI